MTFRAVVERHRRIMDHDWHWRAEEVALDMEETEVSDTKTVPGLAVEMTWKLIGCSLDFYCSI